MVLIVKRLAVNQRLTSRNRPVSPYWIGFGRVLRHFYIYSLPTPTPPFPHRRRSLHDWREDNKTVSFFNKTVSFFNGTWGESGKHLVRSFVWISANIARFVSGVPSLIERSFSFWLNRFGEFWLFVDCLMSMWTVRTICLIK